MAEPVFTIGHSNHPVEHLLGLLQKHRVSAVADVRSRPYSRFNPQFNREAVRDSLRAAGIAYVFLGDQLGARPDDAGAYAKGRVSYERLSAADSFRIGLGRVESGAASRRIALMCAERDPIECHRTILVGRQLAARGLAVRHILADGSTEDQAQAVARLFARLKLPERDLLFSHAELVEQAYQRQESAIAFVDGAAEDSPAP